MVTKKSWEGFILLIPAQTRSNIINRNRISDSKYIYESVRVNWAHRVRIDLKTS